MTVRVRSVLKVGGSVLRDRAAYGAVAGRLAREFGAGPTWVVVSAGLGVTDRLVRLREGAGAGVERLLRWHERRFGGPLPPALREELRDAHRRDELGAPGRLLAWGERASAWELRSRLRELGLSVPIEELDREGRPGPGPHALVPGFYLRAPDGGIQLLPRGGGDISAVLVAAGLGAGSVRFWKDRGGIWLDGRPVRRVDAAALLPRLPQRIRPIHAEAVRLAARLGIDLQLEDPFRGGHTTRVRSGARRTGPRRRRWAPGELLEGRPAPDTRSGGVSGGRIARTGPIDPGRRPSPPSPPGAS